MFSSENMCFRATIFILFDSYLLDFIMSMHDILKLIVKKKSF